MLGGVAGDQQAALFGQNCFAAGLAKNTYGTGCFMLMNVGSSPVPSKHQLITTVAWKADGRTDFALEGSVFIGGAVVQWLRDGLGIVRSSAEIEALAASVPSSDGVYLVPAFAGLGAPHWDQYARGTITGLTRGTTAAHLARAALEGIAFQVADILDIMKQDSGMAMNELRVDGGACANNLLMQFQADILQTPVVRPKVIETTALGAAYLAGLATGFWKNRDEVHRAWQVDRTFEPQMKPEIAAHRRRRWTEALRRAMAWEEEHP
jgi:glycerol kinase